MATADEVLAAATPLTGRISVCLRGDLLGRMEDLSVRYSEAATADAMSNAPDTAPLVLDELRAATAEAQAAEVEFQFQAIPSPEWARLLAEHPDPAGQLAFDPASFPAAAVAASLIEPTGFDVDKVKLLERSMNDGQWRTLWGCCLEVNRGDGDLPKYGRLFGLTPGSGPNSITAAPTASPTPSS